MIIVLCFLIASILASSQDGKVFINEGYEEFPGYGLLI
jgi:hypothetical protein